MQVVVDELAAAVGVQGAQGERHPRANQQQRLEDPLLRLVQYGADLRPLRHPVGEHQGEGVIAAGEPAVVADQVAPSSPGRASCHSVKVRIGIWFIKRVVGLVWERPRMRRARFSVRSNRSTVAALMRVSFWRVSGSTASSPNFSSTGSCVCRTATSRLPHKQPKQVPDLPQRGEDLLVVDAAALAPRPALADHDLDQFAVAALEHRLAPHAQQPPGVVAGAAVQLDELVEHRRLLTLAGAPVPVGHLSGDRLSLTHGKSHLLRPPP